MFLEYICRKLSERILRNYYGEYKEIIDRNPIMDYIDVEPHNQIHKTMARKRPGVSRGIELCHECDVMGIYHGLLLITNTQQFVEYTRCECCGDIRTDLKKSA